MLLILLLTSLVAQMVKRLSTMQETRVRSLGWEDPLEKEMAIHSSTIPWKIPWTEEPGRLQSMGWQRVRHDWATSLSLFTFKTISILHRGLRLREVKWSAQGHTAKKQHHYGSTLCLSLIISYGLTLNHDDGLEPYLNVLAQFIGFYKPCCCCCCLGTKTSLTLLRPHGL